MDSSNKVSYIFRKHPWVRVFSLIFVIAAVFFVAYLISHKTEESPVIESIIPPVGSPGDVVLITGKNFGDERDMSYVSFSGSKITSSSYISWSDTQIKLVLPANVQDGLVIVGTKEAQSNPALFANEGDIPVLVPTTQQIIKPTITSLSTEKISIGEKLIILGNNFGETRNNSKVLFTIDYNNNIKNASYINKRLTTENLVEVSAEESGYEYWSNTEIHVRVPSGARTGVVIVENDKNSSDPYDIEILETAGSREYLDKKIYVVQYNADVIDVETSDVSTITLRCPIPVKIPSQNAVDVTEIQPVPLIQNYQNCNVQQFKRDKNSVYKNSFTQTFVLPVYEVRTKVNPDKIGSMKNLNSAFYMTYTRKDSLVPADTDELVDLYKQIVGKEKNYYKRAKLIYDYMCDNYSITKKNRKNDADPMDLITKEKGDAYDFTIIYAALLRTAGIPCVVNSGILINQNLTTQNHWWVDFYMPGVGWIPVDIALGAGMEYKPWSGNIDARDYYFGNMDRHSVTFSRGYTEMKPLSQDNKIITYSKSFALQSIWEEASNNTIKYSSYWSVPVINGVY